MTREEFMKFASAIKAYYPRDNFLPTSESKELWYAELKDVGYEEAQVGLRKYVQTNKFSPTIADIRQSVADNRSDDEGWSRGYETMRKAIRRFGYMQESQAMESLDPITRETTRRLGWKTICMADETDPTIRANFRMIYEQVAGKSYEINVISSDVLEQIGKIKIGSHEAILLGETDD